MKHSRWIFSRGSLPAWFPFLDLGLAAAGGALWYLQPWLGPWPLLLVAAPWLVRLVWIGRLGRRTPFDLPLLLFAGTAGLSVWSAFDREAAWGKFWLIVGGVFLFYALANGLSERDRKGTAVETSTSSARTLRRQSEWMAWAPAVIGAGVAVYFLATHEWDLNPGKFAVLEQIGRALQAPLPELPGHRLNANVAGGITATLMPFTVWITIISGQRLDWRKAGRGRLGLFLAALGLLLVTGLGLLLSGSRGAWLALAAAGLLSGWGLLSRSLSGRRPNRRAWIFFGGLAAGAAAVWMMLLLWPHGLNSILNTLPDPASGLKRIDLYSSSLILAMDYPLIGAGLDGFMMLYSTYALLLHVGFSTHSHNLFLDVAIEQGLPALLVLGWMWLTMGEAVWRAFGKLAIDKLRRRKRRRSRGGIEGLGWAEAGVRNGATLSRKESDRPASNRQSKGPTALNAAALSLVVMLVHGLVDDPLYGSRAVLLFFMPLAFAVPQLTASQPAALREQWPVWAAGLVLVLLAVVIWWRPLSSMAEANLAAVRQSRAELAVYSWPEWPVQDALRRSLDMTPVVAGYERALALNADYGPANRRLGQIELSLGEYEQALAHLEAAYRATPWDNATRQLLGEGYIVNGKSAEGEVLWEMVNDEQGQLDIRAFWYGHVGDVERVAAVEGVVGR